MSNNKLWKEIVNEFEIPSSCTSASFTLRNHYNKCLLQYEKKYFLGHSNLDLDPRNGGGDMLPPNIVGQGAPNMNPFYPPMYPPAAPN